MLTEKRPMAQMGKMLRYAVYVIMQLPDGLAKRINQSKARQVVSFERAARPSRELRPDETDSRTVEHARDGFLVPVAAGQLPVQQKLRHTGQHKAHKKRLDQGLLVHLNTARDGLHVGPVSLHQAQRRPSRVHNLETGSTTAMHESVYGSKETLRLSLAGERAGDATHLRFLVLVVLLGDARHKGLAPPAVGLLLRQQELAALADHGAANNYQTHPIHP